MVDDGVITVAFDGECLLCSRGMRFLAERDRHKRLRFVPLQSKLGREMEGNAGSSTLSTVLMKTGDRVLSRSDGILCALGALGGVWGVLAKLGRFAPRWLRDRLYDYIAAHRYRWFGKGGVCALPSDSLRERMIDGDRV